MRILLIGEYSRLHNSLKEGLVKLGHDVVLVGNGDGFKNFPADYNIDAKWSKSKIPNWFRQALFRATKYDFARLESGIRFYFLLKNLKGFDVVQLISETPVHTSLWFELKLLQKLRRQNDKLFVLSSGTDVVFMNAVMAKKFRYSLFDPYQENHGIIDEYRHILPYLTQKYKDHHEKVMALADGMIATDVDYLIALDGQPKSAGMIPNPVNTDKIVFNPPEIANPIVIFHGINRWNYHKKGNVFFEKALEIVGKKYGDRVRIITTENIPYNQYINLYNGSHIVLDQVYAYDQGYNALEAMAKGKVVFTGAEKEFMEHYGLTEPVAINALPHVNSIVGELSHLIENPLKIGGIGRNARNFVEREHHFGKIAEQYLNVWYKKRTVTCPPFEIDS